MRCPRCSAENPAGMKFCGQCGAGLGSACPACGSSNPPEDRFCGHCGSPLYHPGRQDSLAPEAFAPHATTPAVRAGGGLPGEMKQVTVLFCDIVGSMPLTERLGAEAMRDLVAAFLKTSLTEVQRYGGTVPQFTGDGFMALFGAPVSQEDHVQRALLAALAIRRALGGPQEARGDTPPELRVRIGTHTGAVVFGPVADSLAMDPTAIGDTANVAARLQTAAEPGMILLSEATFRLAQSYVQVEPVGPLTLRGKAEPVSAFRLIEVSHSRAALRSSATARITRFIDRQGDLAILNNFLKQVESGRRQAVGIIGEPGIGKSRLLDEFRRQLGDNRVRWIEGRCVSYGTAIPYLLLLDLLRSNCGITETDTPEAISDKIRAGLLRVGLEPDRNAPVLLHLLGIDEAGASSVLSNPETVKAKTFEVFRQISIKLSQERPLILVLEDLHWVDKISEEFLGYLGENLSDGQIMMLATYRPGYRPPWLRQSYAGQIPLQPLSRDDSVQVVRSVLLTEPLVQLVTNEIVAKADGNPFFLEQLSLHAGETLRSGLMVPDTVHDVVMARIDRLPGETKQVLQTAAVIGREFSPRLLSAVWNGTGELDAHLHELTRLEFVDERVVADGMLYVFRHALTQETAYGSLLDRQRRAYHAEIGRALEEIYRGRTEEAAELLAFHFGRSDETEKAVDYAILAAEKAQRRWANTDSLNYCGEALTRLDALPDSEANRRRRIDAVIKQSEVKFALGLHAEQLEALTGIGDLVARTDEPHRQAAWHYWTGFLLILTGGQPTVAIEHCNAAVALAMVAGSEDIKAFAESCLAQVYTVAGRLHEAIEVGERALSSFEQRGDLWWAGRTLWHLSVAANSLGNWDASLEYCRRGLEHGIALNDLRLKAVSWLRMGSAHIQQGNLERGLECCNQALGLAPNPFDTAMAKGIRGYAEIKAGRVKAGMAELSAAVGWFEKSALRYTYLHQALWLAEGHLRQGNCDSARPLIEDVLNTSRLSGYRHFKGRACWLMSECLAAQTSPDTPEEYAESAMRVLERVGARNDLAKAMVTRAALHQRAGNAITARRLLEEAYFIFQAVRTRDEPARVEAALLALDSGSPIGLLSSGS